MTTGAVQSGDVQAPSARALAAASVFALVAAAVVLVAAVLPAEYGIDPIGTGRLFGFSALSEAVVPEPVPVPQGAALAPVKDGVKDGRVAWYPGHYNVDARTFVLGPYEYIEFKYHLAKDATMLFSWTATASVLHDFHGDRDGAASDSSESYDKRPRQSADGSFTAPFSGIHGWFWENPGGRPVTVKLTTTGFYTTAHEFHFDRTRQVRRVQGLDAIPGSPQ